MDAFSYPLETYITKARNSSLEQWIARIEPFEFVDLLQKELQDGDMAEVLKYAVYEKKCYSLNLSRNHFTCRSMPLVSHALRRLKNLQDLDLSFNPIADKGAKILAEALTSPNCFLEELDLTSTSIEDEGARYLAAALPHNLRLKRLILSKNAITKHGLDAFIEPLTDPKTPLKLLKFEGNPRITLEDMRDFLRRINAQQCNIREIYFSRSFRGSMARPIRVFNCCNGSLKVFY